MISDDTIGGNVRRARIAARMTEQELGDHIGLVAFRILQIEMGDQPLLAKEVVRVAAALKIPVTDLLTEVPSS